MVMLCSHYRNLDMAGASDSSPAHQPIRVILGVKQPNDGDGGQ